MLDGSPTRTALAVMVAGVVVLHTGVAVVMLLAGPERWSSPTFTVARGLLPIHGWAVIFAIVAVAMAVGVAARHGDLVARAAVLGAGLCAFWAVLLILAAHRHAAAGVLGVVLFLSAACSHVAVAVAVGLLPGRR